MAHLEPTYQKEQSGLSPASPASATLVCHLPQEVRASVHPRAMSPRWSEWRTPHRLAGCIPALVLARRYLRQPRATYRTERRSALLPHSCMNSVDIASAYASREYKRPPCTSRALRATKPPRVTL